MSTYHNYVPNRFSQINLDDGSKILVSVGATDMKVFVLGFFGFPKETLHTFDSLAVKRISLLWRGDVLQFVSSQLLILSAVGQVSGTCESIEEMLKICPD